jgi:hypothetical protein
VTRPISGTLIGLIVIFIIWQIAAFFWQMRKARVIPIEPVPLPE